MYWSDPACAHACTCACVHVWLQVVIPAWIGYELFLWATSAGDAVGTLVSGSQDPFAGL